MNAIDLFGAALIVVGAIAFGYGLALCVVKDTPTDGAE